jgi:hypothetical protein
VKRSTKLFLLLIALLIIVTGIVGISIRNARLNELREAYQFSIDQIESRTPVKTPPVLVIEGTVSEHHFDPMLQGNDGSRDFELVMQGFTNYFRKETWGTESGQGFFWGSHKFSGHETEIRTKNFSGDWREGWVGTGHGTQGGGGGAGFDEYQDDILPGRWLWNRNGFVGAQSNYENHDVVIYEPHGHRELYEEYQNCKLVDGLLIPQIIIWKDYEGLHNSGEPILQVQRVFKVKSIKFQDALSNGWFEAQIKLYIPDYAHEKITNAPPAAASTNL